MNLPGALDVHKSGRELELLGNGNSEQLMEILRAQNPEELPLRIVVAGGNFCRVQNPGGGRAMNALLRKEIRLLLGMGYRVGCGDDAVWMERDFSVFFRLFLPWRFWASPCRHSARKPAGALFP